ncbi:MAG TPA: TIGR01777 family oxidoreductase [Ignavibacteria bacterium]|nr:TIGR01777 family protein [Bacteroidota bacterium]HRI85252.1 TIGR01777 family oxidoreductase [Ignavibacteria bacterium]HRK00015.1 TIGR01777 family oxidoreductase [Ignavibacteria bacterium]
MEKRILVTGATGLIGKNVVNELCSKGSFVKILTYSKDKAKDLFKKHYTVQIYDWSKFEDPFTLSGLISETDCIINLAGENISGKKWDKKFKEKIYNSRINLTQLISESIRFAKIKPECLINASGVGIYGFRGDEILTEDADTGKDFLAKLCIDWETEALKSVQYDVRVVTLRTGIVLDKKEGALSKLMIPFKFFAGGYQGSGKQWISWIHIKDITSLICFAVFSKNVTGALNACSPEPVTNKNFSKVLGEVLEKPSFMPVPSFMLKAVVGEFAENLLHGQKAYPKKALESGFTFEFPNLKEALQNILSKT